MFHQHNCPRNEYRSPTPLKPHTHSHSQTHTCSALHTHAPERNPMPSGGQGWQNRDQMMSHTSHQWDGSCERDCLLSGLMCSRRSCQTHTQIPHTRKNTHTDTQVLGPPHQEGLILQWTPTLAKTGCAVILPPRIKRANLLLKHAKMISLTLYNNVQVVNIIWMH